MVRLRLEGSSDCSKDHVDIYDGWTVDRGVRIARLCGTDLPAQPYFTDTNIAVVSFVSDEVGADAGFRIEYKPQGRRRHMLDSSTNNNQSKLILRMKLEFRQTSLKT